MWLYDRHKSPGQSYQVAAFKPVGPLVYNSTLAFSSPRKHTGNGTGYGLHPHKSSPPSSSSDRGTSRQISQTRWPHKSRFNVNMVFVIAGVRSVVGGRIKRVDGRAAVGAANYHYVNRTSAHSLFRIMPRPKRVPPRARSRM